MKELATYLPDEVQKLTLVCIASEADAVFAEMRREHVQHLIEHKDELSKRLNEYFDHEIAALKRRHAEEIERLQADHRRLVRDLDAIWNGDAAAKQASLCDMVGQISKELPTLRKQAERYEKLRRLVSGREYRRMGCLYGEPSGIDTWLDSLVDQLPASGEASEEEQARRCE